MNLALAIEVRTNWHEYSFDRSLYDDHIDSLFEQEKETPSEKYLVKVSQFRINKREFHFFQRLVHGRLFRIDGTTAPLQQSTTTAGNNGNTVTFFSRSCFIQSVIYFQF